MTSVTEVTPRGFNLSNTPRVEQLRDILVVDDDMSIRSMLSAILRREGYSVREAVDGGDAMRLLDQKCPDVVLLDLMMPGVDGWDFLRLLRVHCTSRNIPVPRVIIVSAHLRVNPQELLALGADALVTKPFNIEELYTLLRHLPEPVVA